MLPTSLNHYRILGRSGLRVSPLCLGTMTFGTDWGWGADEPTSRRIFEAYLAAGGNFIDTAVNYTNGTSETFLGAFLAGRREQVVLATKYSLNTRKGDPNAGGNHRKALRQALEASLKRLRTDYIDLYWVHAWDGRTPIDEVMRALDDVVRQGKVLAVGVSDFPAWKIAQANTLADWRGSVPFCALQMRYSLVDRACERDLLPMARDLGLAFLPWGPLASGVLTGKYSHADLNKTLDEAPKGTRATLILPSLDARKLAIIEAVQAVAKETGRSASQVALNWCLQRPGVTSVIIGARTVEQLEDNLGCLPFALTADQIQRLDQAAPIELGFPHDFLSGEMVRGLLTGGAVIE